MLEIHALHTAHTFTKLRDIH